MTASGYLLAAAVFLLAVTHAVQNMPPKDPECRNLIDYCLVVDASDSISADDYKKQKKALKDLIGLIKPGPRRAHVCIVVYSTTIAHTVNMTGDRAALLRQIDRFKHPRDGTNTDLAIEEMNFQMDKFGREGVPRVGIVITDGLSKNKTRTLEMAEISKTLGINMFAVGVGYIRDPGELRAIASHENQVIKIKSFDKLGSSLIKLVKTVCPCKSPPKIRFAIVTDKKRSIGTKVQYECKKGYILTGNPEIECLKNSTWSYTDVKCEGCPKPMDIIPYAKAELIGDKSKAPYPTGATRDYRCLKGTAAPGPVTITCDVGPGGPKWTDPSYICTGCPKPMPVPKARFAGFKEPDGTIVPGDDGMDDYSVGTVLAYRCRNGFVTNGTLERTCESNNGYPRWTDVVGRCIKCDEPPPFPNAYVQQGGTQVGDERIYICNSPYVETGPIVTKCASNNGMTGWLRPEHNCTGCPKPMQNQTNSVLIPINQRGPDMVGAIREYQCKKGMVAPGPVITTCEMGKNGPYWTTPPFDCSPCPYPMNVDNALIVGQSQIPGQIIPSDLWVGSMLIYVCNDGYIPDGSTEIKCFDENGIPSWRGSRFSCITCGDPPLVPLAYLDSKGSNKVGEKRRYVCDKNYKESGPIIVECVGKNGVADWVGPKNGCGGCPKPMDELANGKLIVVKPEGPFGIGSIVRYQCYDGLVAPGPVEIKCLDDPSGPRWSDPNFICDACPVPMPIKNSKLARRLKTGNEIIVGKPTPADRLVGTPLTYVCQSGYIPSGPLDFDCMANKGYPRWSEVLDSCIKCKTPRPVKNARLEGGGTKVGDTRRYVCTNGYLETGPIVIKCVGKNGRAEWTTSKNTCGGCPEPVKEQANAVLVPIDGTVPGVLGTTRDYNCYDGMVSPGAVTITCKEGHNGPEWTEPSYQCSPCDLPMPMDNAYIVPYDKIGGTVVPGLITPADQLVGSRLVYICKEGFIATANLTTECLPGNGMPKWDKIDGRCIKCRNPPMMDNADVDDRDITTVGAVRYYKCRNGYVQTGPIITECIGKNGMTGWKPPKHKCIIQACGQPRDVANAMLVVVGIPNTAGSMRSYRCLEGYVATGPITIQCRRNRQGRLFWTKPKHGCVGCDMPSEVKNAVLDPNGDFTIGSLRYLTCKPGYVETGKIVIGCVPSIDKGIWTTPEHYCDWCKTLPVIDHATLQTKLVQGQDMTIGTTLKYRCDPGYAGSNVGHVEVTCEGFNNKARWSTPSHECIACPEPPPLDNALVEAGDNLVGTKRIYKCKHGYYSTGPVEVTCGADGQWTQPINSCSACGPPPIVQHAVASDGPDVINTERLYICDHGYIPSDTPTVKCLPNAKWSKPLFKCITCLKPKEMNNAVLKPGSNLIKSVRSYQCKPGYLETGPLEIICQDNAKWSTTPNYCKDCGEPYHVDNAILLLGPRTIGSVQRYRCKDNFVPAGDTFSKCKQNAEWTIPKFRCFECGPPPQFPRAVLLKAPTTIDSVAVYGCDSGFNHTGPDSLACLPTAEWENKTIECSGCGAPPTPEHAIELKGSLPIPIGTVIEYQCKDGFTSVGVVSVECLPNLTWSSALNLCHDCGPPTEIPNAYPTLGPTTIGSVREYACNDGYDISGYRKVKCEKSGKWSEAKFRCSVRTTTTTTTPAPKPEDPSICDNCSMDNGVGYMPHSFDCTKYIHCYFGENGGIEAAHRGCAHGLFWDQGDLTCKEADDVDCEYDPCRNPKVKYYEHSDKKKCCAYWECERGKSKPRCCGTGKRFLPKQGCVDDPECDALCPEDDELPGCDKSPVGDITKYKQYIGDGKSRVMPCAPGTGFSVVDCECTLNVAIIPGFVCKPEILMPFTHGIYDESKNRAYIRNDNVTFHNGAAKFNGNSRLLINRFSNSEFRGHLVITLRYKEDKDGPFPHHLQALVTNGDCGADPSIILAKMPRFVLLGAKTDTPKSFGLPTVDKEWKEVIYMHDEQKLGGKVCGAAYNKYSWGPIRSTHCGIQIGYGTGLKGFAGEMDDIAIYQCRPSDAILSLY